MAVAPRIDTLSTSVDPRGSLVAIREWFNFYKKSLSKREVRRKAPTQEPYSCVHTWAGAMSGLRSSWAELRPG